MSAALNVRPLYPSEPCIHKKDWMSIIGAVARFASRVGRPPQAVIDADRSATRAVLQFHTITNRANPRDVRLRNMWHVGAAMNP